MAVEVTHNHNINFAGMDKFGASLDMLATKINTLVGGTSTASAASNLNANNKNQQTQSPLPLSKTADTLDSSIKELIKSLNKISRLDTLAKIGMNTSERQTLRDEERKDRQARQQDWQANRQARREENNKNRWENIGRGIMTGAVMAAVYQASNIGSVFGSESRSVNVGANSYNQFIKSYYDKRIDTEKGLGSGALIGAAGLGLAYGGPLGGIIGGGLAAVGNFGLGYLSEQKKSANELALNQDILSYRLQGRGISGSSNSELKFSKGFGRDDVGIPVSALQSAMQSPEFAPYLPYLSQIVAGSRQDIFSNQSETDINKRIQGQAGFAKQIARSGLLTGTEDLAGLAHNVTNLSAMSGKSPTELLTKLTNDNVKYGGDMVANTAKMVQLMQSSSMSQDRAANLVNKFQYNDAEVQNQVNMQKAPYTSKVIGRLLMQVAGASEEEQQAGRWSEESLAQYRNADTRIGKLNPRLIMMQNSLAALGQNAYVNPSGGVSPTAGGTIRDTQQMQEFNDMVAKRIADMTITATGTVNIIASQVNTNNINETSRINPSLPAGITTGDYFDFKTFSYQPMQKRMQQNDVSGTGTSGVAQ